MSRAPWALYGAIVAGAAAAALQAQAPPPPDDEARIAAGAEIFAASCGNQYCHGSAGQGAQGPKLVGVPMTWDHIRNVVREGRSGTPMVSFREVLEPEQIDAVSLYVLSISSNGRLRQIPATPQVAAGAPAPGPGARAPEPPPPSTEPVAIGKEQGTPAAGLAAFFDSTRLRGCRGCHSINGRGGPVGPDFKEAQLTPAQALAALGKPRSAARAYPPITVMLMDGTRLSGIRGPETAEELVVYDVGAIPAVKRTFQKDQVAEVKPLQRGLFDHTSLGYTRQQLVDLAALIGSAGGT